jgi:dethiobiotin synthetase
MSGLFVTGTDTDVGKTFATAALLVALESEGLVVAPMKPVAAGTIMIGGVAMNADVALMMELSRHRYPLRTVNPYCFSDPIAPHIAANRENVNIDLAIIECAYRKLALESDCVLMEGAGGFLVPLTETQSMADIPAQLGLPVILVVGMRLGCINHALLTADAIRHRGLKLSAWIANSPAGRMSAYVENLALLRRMLGAPLLAEIAYVPETDTVKAAHAAATLFDRPIMREFLPSRGNH